MACYRQHAETLMERADALDRISEHPDHLTRRSFTSAMRDAQRLVATWMHEAGMATRYDAFGNLIGRYAGETEAPPFVLGGHLDSVEDAGKYDGILGVLAGIAAVEGLRRAGARLSRPVDVVAFIDEEGLRFHSTLVASRAWSGRDPRSQYGYSDRDGVTLEDAIRDWGGDPGAFPLANPPQIAGFLELHIEQGPVLEREDLPIGIVRAIVGSARGEATFEGVAGHAGTVPMDLRHDALAAGAEFVLAVERIASAISGLVGTVGSLDVRPGATNVIAGEVRLSAELRHAEGQVLDHAMAAVLAAGDEIAARRNVSFAWRSVAGYEATPMDAGLIARLENAVTAAGIRPRILDSGAGHDAINVANIAPAAMLFLRCKDGVSHNPLESITAADVAVGLEVLAHFLSDPGSG